MSELFSVVQFDRDGWSHYVARGLGAEGAVRLAKALTDSLPARIGLAARIIITDSGDDTVFEWKHGKGVTFPKEAAARRDEP